MLEPAHKDLLRIVFAGSVDDGKSTLLGRLFYDADQIYEDQLEALKRASNATEEADLDLSLYTDGLESEREQKITIDVAYRYFNLGKRRLIIADVPGHEQYTRNMVTGASNANVALILADARKGLLPQSKRHMFIAALLGIPHVLVVVNKMDLVGYEQEAFESIKKQFTDFAAKLRIADLQFIPVSAAKGDMVVHRGPNLSWYQGSTIYHYLENIEIQSDQNRIDFRLPVQTILRPNQDTRAYAGLIESGSVKVGEEVAVYPSGKKSRVKKMWVAGSEDQFAEVPQSIAIQLEDELDISRGDMLARPKNPPDIAMAFDANLCWMSETELKLDKKYLIKQTTKTTGCHIESVLHQIDINTLHRKEASAMSLNDIGIVRVKTMEPLLIDIYQKNRNTGSFIIIDPETNNTVAAGTIIRKITPSSNVAHSTEKHGAVLWFTGLSGAGKTTIANALHQELRKLSVDSEHLDGDVMRECLCKDLGFSKQDRDTNIERAAFVARMLASHGVLVLASFISPYERQRSLAREGVENFIEIFVNAPLAVCEARDVKGLYKKARNGEIKDFTGIDDPYEEPQSPEITINTADTTLEESVKIIIDHLRNNGLI